MNTPSRRFMLGAAGAAALSTLTLPFRAKAQDIVVASEIPPKLPAAPQPKVRKFRLYEVGAMLTGRVLQDVQGNDIGLIEGVEYGAEVFEDGSFQGFQQYRTGIRRMRLSCVLVEDDGWPVEARVMCSSESSR